MHIKGPFYGLLGYSQGSALIPIYLGKVFYDLTREIGMLKLFCLHMV